MWRIVVLGVLIGAVGGWSVGTLVEKAAPSRAVPTEGGAAAKSEATLEVRVLGGKERNPVPSVQVQIRGVDRRHWYSVMTGGDGVGRTAVEPGECSIEWAYVLQGEYASAKVNETVRVKKGETRRVQILLTERPTVTGRVLDLSGRPLAGVKVRVLPTGAVSCDSLSDSAGRFEASYDPQPWSGSAPDQFVLIARQAESNLAEAVTFGEGRRDMEVKLRPGVVVRGTVVGRGKEPVSGAWIHPNFQRENWSTTLGDDRVQSDAKGGFEVKALPVGQSYVIYVYHEGYAQKPVPVAPAAVKDGRVNLGVIALDPADLTVSGTVVDEDHQPVPGAQVSAYGEAQPSSQVAADAEGNFTLGKFGKGALQLSASARDGKLWGYAPVQAGAEKVVLVVRDPNQPVRPKVKVHAALVDKPFPKPSELGINLDEARGKSILVCFHDPNNRPSRFQLRQLAAKSRALAEAGIHVVKVDVSKLPGDRDLAAWDVWSVPWLILMDSKHLVRAEGAGLDDVLPKTGTGK